MSKLSRYETFPEFIPDNRLYKWSHSVAKGGWYFCLGTKDRKPLIKKDIKNMLENRLRKEAINLELVDTTIKIYPTFFVVFTALRPRTHQLDFADRILGVANEFEVEWDKYYILNVIADVGTNFIENYMSSLLSKKIPVENTKDVRLTKFITNDDEK